ncbi:MAG TPA: hypothetical protein VGF97_06560 [Rhizomicrobium sp.]|jgi:hypothetical protein
MKANKKAKTRTTMVLRMLPEENRVLIQDSKRTLLFNVAAFRETPEHEVRKAVRSSFVDAATMVSNEKRSLVTTVDFKAFTVDMINNISNPDLGNATIGAFLGAIAEYRSQNSALHGKDVWRDAPPFEDYDMTAQPAAVRYGNVELRVIENYLLEPENLRAALENIVEKLGDEGAMYANVKMTAKLTHDDPDFNVRRLMTNAGFYVGQQRDKAWQVLDDWAKRYIAAMCESNLIWQNSHAFHYLKIQRALYEQNGAVPAYVEKPNRHSIYENIAGREVLFVSPLAHIVNHQFSSGNMEKLYKTHKVPEFSLRAIPAYMSTWPNRPHENWSETFERMCDSVRAAYRERPFDVFIASCGCYGLPISQFARSEYGCSTLYVGHGAHTLFGLFPNPESQTINLEMWAKGDLGRYANVDRIDGGRYV